MLSLAGILLLSAAALGYVYVAYPLLLWLMVRVRGARPVHKGPGLPRVSLIISAFNEAPTIAGKLRNSLALDYPADRLEIVVVSDASDDGTDDIVRSFSAAGVRLRRQAERRGKTAGLNRVMPEVTGEVVVFSDANAMYDPAALRMLVRNFDDPDVGCVTGEARYLTGGTSAASRAERLYWAYEIQLKRLETAVGSMVGGDGAIYAIRRQLWSALPEDAINDFLNPLQIVGAGWRGVYEPDAVCHEETAGDTRREYRRRVRIVSRSWRAVFQAGSVLNPFRVGFFALSLLSHKVLRWMTGFFVACILVSSVLIGWHADARSRRAILLAAAAYGVMALVWPTARRTLGFLIYYLTISTASVVGLVKGSLGRVSGMWTTPRAEPAADPTVPVAAASPVRMIRPGPLLLALIAVATVAAIAVLVLSPSVRLQVLVFGAAVAMMVYVYFGYPVLLAIARPLFRRPVHKAPFLPSVTLIVAANDEAGVIEAKLRNSVAVDYPADRLSIVVASDGSVDGTNAIVRAFAAANVRLLAYEERRGKISAINDAIAQVESDVVVFSDANTFLRPDAVRALVRNFADETVGAVSGDVILVGDRAALATSEDLYYRYERWLQQAESDIGSMLGVDGALYAIRRTLFVPPPTDTILDDMAVPMAIARNGHRVVFEPDAIAHEGGSDSGSEEFSRKVRVVAGAVQFLLRPDSAIPLGDFQLLASLVSHKTLRWLSPVFATIAFVAAVVLAPHSPWFFWFASLQAASMVAALLGCLPAIRRISVFGIAYYFWLVQTAALVGFARGLLGRQAVAWRRFARTAQVTS